MSSFRAPEEDSTGGSSAARSTSRLSLPLVLHREEDEDTISSSSSSSSSHKNATPSRPPTFVVVVSMDLPILRLLVVLDRGSSSSSWRIAAAMAADSSFMSVESGSNTYKLYGTLVLAAFVGASCFVS